LFSLVPWFPSKSGLMNEHIVNISGLNAGASYLGAETCFGSLGLLGSMFHFWCPDTRLSPDQCTNIPYRETFVRFVTRRKGCPCAHSRKREVFQSVPMKPVPVWVRTSTQTYRETHRETFLFQCPVPVKVRTPDQYKKICCPGTGTRPSPDKHIVKQTCHEAVTGTPGNLSPKPDDSTVAQLRRDGEAVLASIPPPQNDTNRQ
jgi:hypothetical protein